MGSLHTIHTSDVAGRGLSGPIWSSCPFEEIMIDPSYGHGYKTDFTTFGGTVTTNVGTYAADGVGGIKSFEDTTGTSILQLDNTVSEYAGGVIRGTMPATDNHQVSMEFGYGNGGSFIVGAGIKSFFEARIRLTTLTTELCFFVGLAEAGLSVNDGLWADNATTTGTKDLLGFCINSATATVLRPCYGVNGTATTLVTTTKTLTSATWYKVGVLCDGKYIHFYIDGVEYGTPILTTDTNVPDGILLTPFWGMKNGAATARTFDLDWLSCYQSQYQVN
jgi:hypothetical protein